MNVDYPLMFAVLIAMALLDILFLHVIGVLEKIFTG
jgi:hypothetical protein